MDKQRVLFVCRGNSARSIMGEAILRHLAGDRYEAHSAGLVPAVVLPETVAVLEEAGLATEGLHSKSVDEYLGKVFCHYVIAVCNEAAEHCPRVWPLGGVHLFWAVSDPAAETGGQEQRMNAFRSARDEMWVHVKDWLADQEAARDAR